MDPPTDPLWRFLSRFQIKQKDRLVLTQQHGIKSIQDLIAELVLLDKANDLGVSRDSFARLLNSVHYIKDKKKAWKMKLDDVVERILSMNHHYDEGLWLNRPTKDGNDAALTFPEAPLLSDNQESDETTPSEKQEELEIFQLLEDSPWDWGYDTKTKEVVLSDDGVRVPTEVFKGLKPYQRDGLAWLLKRFQSKVGGILGDEMGMGKTRQVLVFLFALMQTNMIRKALFVCPPTIIDSIIEEAEQKLLPHFPRLKEILVVKITKTGDICPRNSMLKVALKSGRPLLVVTSDCLIGGPMLSSGAKKSATNPLFPGSSHCWDYVVIDEAHRAKNMNSQRHKAIKKLRRDRTHLLMMTATPMQNDPEELYSLVSWVTKGKVLGSLHQFKEGYGKQIRDGLSEAAAKNLQKELEPYILQRKNNLLKDELPPKKDFVVPVRPTDEQQKCMVKFFRSDTVKQIFGPGNQNANAFACITRLRLLCISAPFFEKSRDDKGVELFLKKHASNEQGQKQLLRQSSKLQVCFDLLEQFQAEGHKTLVFSNFTKELDFLQAVLGDNVYRIDGEVLQTSRTSYKEAFNKDNSKCKVMLLSTPAGGLGLTLTGADRVIILGPSWNPEIDAQAAARAYRIGQNKPVEVYRLITAGTVEEKMLCKQIDKGGMIREVFSKACMKRYFNKEELRDVFNLESKLDRLKEEAAATSGDTKHFDFITKHPHVCGLLQHGNIYKAGAYAFAGGSSSEWVMDQGEFAQTERDGKKRAASAVDSDSEEVEWEEEEEEEEDEEFYDALESNDDCSPPASLLPASSSSSAQALKKTMKEARALKKPKVAHLNK